MFKHHVLHNRESDRFPEGFQQGLAPEQRVVSLWWEGSFEYGERVFVSAEELDPYLAEFVTEHRHTVAVPERSRSREVPRAAQAPLRPPATAGRIVTSSPSSTVGVEAVEEADVLAAHVDVHEPAQVAVLGDPVAQAVVAVVEAVEHVADGGRPRRRSSRPRRR